MRASLSGLNDLLNATLVRNDSLGMCFGTCRRRGADLMTMWKKINIEMFPLNYEVEDLGLSEHSVLQRNNSGIVGKFLCLDSGMMSYPLLPSPDKGTKCPWPSLF